MPVYHAYVHRGLRGPQRGLRNPWGCVKPCEPISLVAIEKANFKHLKPFFGKALLCDITADDISRYQASRLKEQASPKTIIWKSVRCGRF